MTNTQKIEILEEKYKMLTDMIDTLNALRESPAQAMHRMSRAAPMSDAMTAASRTNGEKGGRQRKTI